MELIPLLVVSPAWVCCDRVKVPCIMNSIKQRIPDYGNCGIARFRGKEAYVKDVSPRTGTGYKADGMGELAPHSEALGAPSTPLATRLCL